MEREPGHQARPGRVRPGDDPAALLVQAPQRLLHGHRGGLARQPLGRVGGPVREPPPGGLNGGVDPAGPPVVVEDRIVDPAQPVPHHQGRAQDHPGLQKRRRPPRGAPRLRAAPAFHVVDAAGKVFDLPDARSRRRRGVYRPQMGEHRQAQLPGPPDRGGDLASGQVHIQLDGVYARRRQLLHRCGRLVLAAAAPGDARPVDLRPVQHRPAAQDPRTRGGIGGGAGPALQYPVEPVAGVPYGGNPRRQKPRQHPVGQMHVAVNQAGQQRAAFQSLDGCALRHLVRRPHGCDPFPLDQDGAPF